MDVQLERNAKKVIPQQTRAAKKGGPGCEFAQVQRLICCEWRG